MYAYVRVHTSPGKPKKSWDFVAFSRTLTSWKKALVLEISGNLLDLVKKIYEMYGR